MSEQFTEAEWDSCGYPDVLLAFVASRNAPPGAVQPAVLMSERKLRLFLVAYCRAHWDRITSDVCRKAIEDAEQYADGLGTATILAEHRSNLIEMRDVAVDGLEERISQDQIYAAELTCLPFEDLIHPRRWYGRSPDYVPVHPAARVLAASGSLEIIRGMGTSQLYQQQTQLLRDIVGNPFRPVSLDPTWLTSDVLALARGIYVGRAFDRMSILADALQDAGCTSEDILSHCRDTSLKHVRGCWVVDLLLAKE